MSPFVARHRLEAAGSGHEQKGKRPAVVVPPKGVQRKSRTGAFC